MKWIPKDPANETQEKTVFSMLMRSQKFVKSKLISHFIKYFDLDISFFLNKLENNERNIQENELKHEKDKNKKWNDPN